ncbi:phosphotransferase family protein [Luteipulveratus mongoliensis]|uniref:Protein kinase domain-containing protein n=1 Tax=Luteipulveratus mongoliensis TaxID=571913 RepID=A0A0K1JIX2_9MICO|nr:phosphotransferase [Luteipulveratus mongoliensis]AKU16533.1 hypothetical protein VV02_12790 [Luteipulveratus mongoliensis]
MDSTGVDYTRTSERITWDQVPPTVTQLLGEVVGAPVVGASTPVGSGFGSHYAGRVALADGRAVFAKVAPPWLDFPVRALRQEAYVLAHLPDSVPHARLAGQLEIDGWVGLAVDFIPGRMPGIPWTATDLDAAYQSVIDVGIADIGADLTVRQYGHGAPSSSAVQTREALRARRFTRPAEHEPTWLDEVLAEYGPDIVGLADHISTSEGDALVHNDLRPDNLLIDDAGRAVLLDWNWLTRGPVWIDFVGLLPMAHRQGLDISRWTQRPLVADAAADNIDAFLANLVVYFLAEQGRPPLPGCLPAMRQHQLLYAHDFVGLLADRRGWR